MLLAGMPEAALQAYFAKLRPARITTETETNKSALLDAVVEARREGVAQTVDQAGEGVTGTAAPIRDAAQVVIGALIVAAPSTRWQERRAELAGMVRCEAELISRSLGYR